MTNNTEKSIDPTRVEMRIKVIDVQELMYSLFAKFGSEENQEIANRNLQKIKEVKEIK